MLEDPALSPHLYLPVPPATPPRTVRNLWESIAWREQVHEGKGRDGEPADPTFGQNRRNLVLSLNVDGFQPWKRVAYSITPMIMMVLNLPENLRHKAEHLLLAGLIPGPKAPKELNPFMVKLVEELKTLYRTGIEFKDPLTGEIATARVKLLNICADIPALSALLYQQSVAAHHGCFKCHLMVSFDLGLLVSTRIY